MGTTRRVIGIRAANRNLLRIGILALLAIILVPSGLPAKELKQETKSAWETYVQSACLRVETQVKASPFLEINEVPERFRQVQAGEISVWRRAEGSSAQVPRGLIHDWIGAVFIPGATLTDVFAVVRDYDRYPGIYKPAVLEASRLNSVENDDRFSMLLMQKVLFVTAAMKGEYETRYVQVDATHWYSLSQSTRLQAVEGFGQRDMVVYPPDRGPGYVWRLLSITKFQASDGGVYIELEAIGLSRDVPSLTKWLVNPVIEHLPRNSMRATLEETRSAVLARLSHQD